MTTFWAYTLARAAVLLAAFGVLYVAGARGLLLIALAFLVSLLISYWLLAGMRDRLARDVEARAARINQRMAAATQAEDEDDAPEVEAPEVEAASAEAADDGRRGDTNDPARPPA